VKAAAKTLAKRALRALPGPVQGAGRYLDYLVASRPIVDRHQHARLDRGVVVLSLDFELAWAWPYAISPPVDPVATGLREREQVPLLVRTFEEFTIPATWATVGHLFLERCTRASDGRAHPELPRIPHFENHLWRFDSGDWFQHDPCTNLRRDPAWYGPDLIERILASPVKHEIGCHSFSHPGFGPYCPPEVARAELDACRDAMQPFGLEPRTWVFPGNDEGNYQTLRDAGVEIVRSYPRKAHIALPLERADGLWAVHASTGLSRGEGWSMSQRLGRLRGFLEKAMATRMAIHVWLHPSLKREDFDQLLIPFLRTCAQLREQGRLDILTMEGLVAAVGGK
jgi:hypothetical protein